MVSCSSHPAGRLHHKVFRDRATIKILPLLLLLLLQYNPMVEQGTDLEVVDRDNKVSWSATMPIWPCRPRDFVTHIRRANLDDGSVAILNSATTHPKVLKLFF